MTPAETMSAIRDMWQCGRLAEAASHFAENGVLLVEPDRQAVARSAISDGLGELARRLRYLVIDDRLVIQRGNIALHHARWTARYLIDGVPSTEEVGGVTADLLTLHPDGRWLAVINNPWGGDVLDG
jgi:ketosteroid isomerase-like protein